MVALVTEKLPKATILCSVANHPPELKMLLQAHTQLIVLNSNTLLPVMNAYQSPDTLGMDRLAIAVGAHAAFPGKTIWS